MRKRSHTSDANLAHLRETLSTLFISPYSASRRLAFLSKRELKSKLQISDAEVKHIGRYCDIITYPNERVRVLTNYHNKPSPLYPNNLSYLMECEVLHYLKDIISRSKNNIDPLSGDISFNLSFNSLLKSIHVRSALYSSLIYGNNSFTESWLKSQALSNNSLGNNSFANHPQDVKRILPIIFKCEHNLSYSTLLNVFHNLNQLSFISINSDYDFKFSYALPIAEEPSRQIRSLLTQILDKEIRSKINSPTYVPTRYNSIINTELIKVTNGSHICYSMSPQYKDVHKYIINNQITAIKAHWGYRITINVHEFLHHMEQNDVHTYTDDFTKLYHDRLCDNFKKNMQRIKGNVTYLDERIYKNLCALLFPRSKEQTQYKN